jgi:ethanolamine permease
MSDNKASSTADGFDASGKQLTPKRLAPVAGVFLLWGLGVGYVVSGDYYGWNFGLLSTGYKGFLVALAFAAVLYASLSITVAELSAAIPHSGGPYAFARTALGPFAGFMCGVGVLIEYVIAPAAVATAIGAYIHGYLPGLPALVPALGVYVLSTGIHLAGARSSLRLELVLTILAVVALVIFFVVGSMHMSVAKLNDVGGGAVLPNGLSGLWAALPLAAWFFLAIEGLPMAAEESKNPKRDLPRALLYSFVTLAVLAVCTLTVSAGLGGSHGVGGANDPLPFAVRAGLGASSWLVPVITWVGLAGLLASFHGIVLAYSRQLFALARTGYLPRGLAKLNAARTPTGPLLLGSGVGMVLVVVGDQLSESAIPVLVTISVVGAALTYCLMALSAIVLRVRRPDMERPFRAPGGITIPIVTFVFAAILLPAGVAEHKIAVLFALAIIVSFALVYVFYSKKRVAGVSVEQELNLLSQADQELES